MPGPRPTAISAGRRLKTAASPGSAWTLSPTCATPLPERPAGPQADRPAGPVAAGRPAGLVEKVYGGRRARPFRRPRTTLMEPLLPRLRLDPPQPGSGQVLDPAA